MNKKIKLLLFLFVSTNTLLSQNLRTGIYSYNSLYYNERINLKTDGTFMYTLKTEFTQSEIEGNWQIRNDTMLILDSRPQISGITVFESYKKHRGAKIIVRCMRDYPKRYHLYLIDINGDTTVIRDQFDQSIIKNKFNKFYIVNSFGLHSPTYRVIGEYTNFFKVHFEEKRIFENEAWRIVENAIVPMGLNRKYSTYRLELSNRFFGHQ